MARRAIHDRGAVTLAARIGGDAQRAELPPGMRQAVGIEALDGAQRVLQCDLAEAGGPVGVCGPQQHPIGGASAFAEKFLAFEVPATGKLARQKVEQRLAFGFGFHGAHLGRVGRQRRIGIIGQVAGHIPFGAFLGVAPV